MKKFIIICLMLVTMTLPIVLSASEWDATAASALPEYHGTSDDPGILVIHKGDGFWIVKINGTFYVFRPNK
jgi:hypothetical protein